MQSFLSIYTIRLKEKGKRNSEYINFNSFKQKNFFDLLENHLKEYSHHKNQHFFDSNNENMMILNNLKSQNKEQMISGLVEVGAYGITSEFKNINSKDIVFKRNPDDAEMLSFFFFIAIPKNKNEGFLLLQRLGNKGIKKTFEHFLRDFLQKYFKDYSIHIYKVIQEEIINKILLNGTVKKLRFIKHNISHDQYDHIIDDGSQEIKINKEIVLSAKEMPVVSRSG